MNERSNTQPNVMCEPEPKFTKKIIENRKK